jgi:hypothetical protein
VPLEVVQPCQVVERLQARGLVGDEERVEAGVDVSLRDRAGSRDQLAGLDASQATHPGEVDVTSLEGAYDG